MKNLERIEYRTAVAGNQDTSTGTLKPRGQGMNNYRALGLVLTSGGLALAAYAYAVLGSVPLAATGLSALIIGVTFVFLAPDRPPLPEEAIAAILKPAERNFGAIVESLGLGPNKAVYVPRKMSEGRPQALIPVGEDCLDTVRIRLPESLMYAGDAAIAVATPGDFGLRLLETNPGKSLRDIESAMNRVLVRKLCFATRVGLSMEGRRIQVKVSGAGGFCQDTPYLRCLGSPIASIAAAISSEALGKPIRVGKESFDRSGSGIIVLEILT